MHFSKHGVVIWGDTVTPYWPMDLPIESDSLGQTRDNNVVAYLGYLPIHLCQLCAML